MVSSCTAFRELFNATLCLLKVPVRSPFLIPRVVKRSQDLLKRLTDEGAHPKCLQTAFSIEAERQARKLSLGAEKGATKPARATAEASKRRVSIT